MNARTKFCVYYSSISFLKFILNFSPHFTHPPFRRWVISHIYTTTSTMTTTSEGKSKRHPRTQFESSAFHAYTIKHCLSWAKSRVKRDIFLAQTLDYRSVMLYQSWPAQQFENQDNNITSTYAKASFIHSASLLGFFPALLSTPIPNHQTATNLTRENDTFPFYFPYSFFFSFPSVFASFLQYHFNYVRGGNGGVACQRKFLMFHSVIISNAAHAYHK